MSDATMRLKDGAMSKMWKAKEEMWRTPTLELCQSCRELSFILKRWGLWKKPYDSFNIKFNWSMGFSPAQAVRMVEQWEYTARKNIAK